MFIDPFQVGQLNFKYSFLSLQFLTKVNHRLQCQNLSSLPENSTFMVQSTAFLILEKPQLDRLQL